MWEETPSCALSTSHSVLGSTSMVSLAQTVQAADTEANITMLATNALGTQH